MSNHDLRRSPASDSRSSRPQSLTRRESLGLGAFAGMAALFGGSAPVAAATSCAGSMASDLSALKAIRVFTGEDGHSHFEEIDLKARARRAASSSRAC